MAKNASFIMQKEVIKYFWLPLARSERKKLLVRVKCVAS